MEAKVEVLLVWADVAALDGRTEVVYRAEAAFFAATEEPRPVEKRPPSPHPFPPDVLVQNLVLLQQPWPPLLVTDIRSSGRLLLVPPLLAAASIGAQICKYCSTFYI